MHTIYIVYCRLPFGWYWRGTRIDTNLEKCRQRVAELREDGLHAIILKEKRAGQLPYRMSRIARLLHKVVY